jgi:hypothetical protein
MTDQQHKRWVRRADALKVPCPQCSAETGHACAHDPIKVPSHLARHEAALAAGFPEVTRNGKRSGETVSERFR